MSYVAVWCWAERDWTGYQCSDSMERGLGCPGGNDCRHRLGQSIQCREPIANDLGLCTAHYKEIVPC